MCGLNLRDVRFRKLGQPTIMLGRTLDGWLRLMRTYCVFKCHRGHLLVVNGKLAPITLLRTNALLGLYALQKAGEVREAENHNAQIIHRLLLHSRSHYFINSTTAATSHVLEIPGTLPRLKTLRQLPRIIDYDLHSVLRADAVKDSIATDQDKVKGVVYRRHKDLRLNDNTVLIAAILFHFCHTVAECA